MTTRQLQYTFRSSRVIAVAAVAAAALVGAGAAPAARRLPPLAMPGHVPATTEATMRNEDVRQGPPSTEDQALIRRWSELFAAVLGEFQADHRDPVANIEGDFTTREIRIRRFTGGEQWVGRTLTKRELATSNLRALAKRLYRESKR